MPSKGYVSLNIHDRIISTQDGRPFHLREASQPDGIPILALHGTPSAGLLYVRWIEDAQARGIRLLSYDRPGYGAMQYRSPTVSGLPITFRTSRPDSSLTTVTRPSPRGEFRRFTPGC